MPNKAQSTWLGRPGTDLARATFAYHLHGYLRSLGASFFILNDLSFINFEGHQQSRRAGLSTQLCRSFTVRPLYFQGYPNKMLQRD